MGMLVLCFVSLSCMLAGFVLRNFLQSNLVSCVFYLGHWSNLYVWGQQLSTCWTNWKDSRQNFAFCNDKTFNLPARLFWKHLFGVFEAPLLIYSVFVYLEAIAFLGTLILPIRTEIGTATFRFSSSYTLNSIQMDINVKYFKILNKIISILWEQSQKNIHISKE